MTLLGTCGRYLNGLKERAILSHWNWAGPRPELDRRRMAAHLRKMGCPEAPASPQDSRLLVHVAFHFVPSRLKYMRETVEQLADLPFKNIDVVIDTNRRDAVGHSAGLPGVKKVNVWGDLRDPFKLTWMHRAEMAKAADDYDVFMYVEDDLLIPRTTILRWVSEAAKLGRHGFAPGFVRVEENRAGELVLSDFRFPIERPKVVALEGARYLVNPFPYQACWIYAKAEMLGFMASPSYAQGAAHPEFLAQRDGEIGVRESVAVGAIYDDVPPGFPSRALVPLTEDLRLAPDALIFHTPSNYGRLKPPGHPAGLGTVKLSDWAGPGLEGGIEAVELPPAGAPHGAA